MRNKSKLFFLLPASVGSNTAIILLHRKHFCTIVGLWRIAGSGSPPLLPQYFFFTMLRY
ncbi:hypothetical protein V1514DRAFT_335380 [Lipomyces japonicus]|uniref:uncharacterized protein n=1 Tax=Lipomyces japonicus TaxID=56871 RepID=UPI0034CDEC6F